MIHKLLKNRRRLGKEKDICKSNWNAIRVSAYFCLVIFQYIKKPPKIKNQDTGIGVDDVLAENKIK